MYIRNKQKDFESFYYSHFPPHNEPLFFEPEKEVSPPVQEGSYPLYGPEWCAEQERKHMEALYARHGAAARIYAYHDDYTHINTVEKVSVVAAVESCTAIVYDHVESTVETENGDRLSDEVFLVIEEQMAPIVESEKVAMQEYMSASLPESEVISIKIDEQCIVVDADGVALDGENKIFPGALYDGPRVAGMDMYFHEVVGALDAYSDFPVNVIFVTGHGGEKVGRYSMRNLSTRVVYLPENPKDYDDMCVSVIEGERMRTRRLGSKTKKKDPVPGFISNLKKKRKYHGVTPIGLTYVVLSMSKVFSLAEVNHALNMHRKKGEDPPLYIFRLAEGKMRDGVVIIIDAPRELAVFVPNIVVERMFKPGSFEKKDDRYLCVIPEKGYPVSVGYSSLSRRALKVVVVSRLSALYYNKAIVWESPVHDDALEKRLWGNYLAKYAWTYASVDPQKRMWLVPKSPPEVVDDCKRWLSLHKESLM